MNWLLNMVLVCIFLMTNDIEHLFNVLWGRWSSFRKQKKVVIKFWFSCKIWLLILFSLVWVKEENKKWKEWWDMTVSYWEARSTAKNKRCWEAVQDNQEIRWNKESRKERRGQWPLRTVCIIRFFHVLKTTGSWISNEKSARDFS